MDCLALKMTPRSLYTLNDTLSHSWRFKTSSLWVVPEVSRNRSTFIFRVFMDCLALKMTPRSLYTLNDTLSHSWRFKTSSLWVVPEVSRNRSSFIFRVFMDCLALKMTPRSLYTLNDTLSHSWRFKTSMHIHILNPFSRLGSTRDSFVLRSVPISKINALILGREII